MTAWFTLPPFEHVPEVYRLPCYEMHPRGRDFDRHTYSIPRNYLFVVYLKSGGTYPLTYLSASASTRKRMRFSG